ncbi:iron complex transport system ATP-binding protein [Corynebacterium spheniscorum]|uniref:Iron complex transport system ATP-binding protein n=1 Tax=Corynebacterium spheniscorum TaxID=185761 RepID=A0A1I2T184_9CORY|nr:ABC transporter ATP-binding protein [Corynebacterium spheniscorum]KAA8721203.1 ABC transporter ATP-binding protein [Corynebacterium spheniscorum]SFG58550.1 iron complex transport system ATP-binding protein [Corynebacterium spheniscorum]
MTSPASSSPKLASDSIISVSDLHVGYGDRTVLKGLNVEIPRRQITTLIGSNGCGKSTFLTTLARVREPHKGRISFAGTNISELSRRDYAARVGLLPQTPSAPGTLKVSELVLRGRYPHQSWYGRFTEEDEHAVSEALRRTALLDLAERPLNALSGGQRQRAWLAMVLAQDTEVMLLDEPTTYLDLAHAVDMLRLVKSLSTVDGRTIVMVLHDLNLAARYSDHLIAMGSGGQILKTGSARKVLTTELLAEGFGLDAIIGRDPATGGPMVVPAADPI